MYQAIQTTLQRIEAQQNAAEVHGIICGYLCVRPANANSANSDQSWLHVVLGDIEAGNIVAEQGKSVLIKLKTWVLDQLNSADMQIDLLLPTDQESLATRVIALTEWCDGFLLGISLGQFKASTKDSDNVKEFIDDVLRFSQMDTQLEEDEANEKAYMELVEYLRVGMLTFYEELHPVQATKPSLQ